jgi:hypothetical protein
MVPVLSAKAKIANDRPGKAFWEIAVCQGYASGCGKVTLLET